MKIRKLEFNMDRWEKGDTEGTFNIGTMDSMRISTALIGLEDGWRLTIMDYSLQGYPV